MNATIDRIASSETRPISWWQWCLLYPALGVAVIGAMPQYLTQVVQWREAKQKQVPVENLAEANRQHMLWEHNIEKCDMNALTTVRTADNTTVGVLACPTGDVLIRIERAMAQPHYRWIPFETEQREPQRHAANVLSLLGISTAHAQESDGAKPAPAQGTVVCQRWGNDGVLLRRVRSTGGQCVEERVNTYNGRVIETRVVNCNPC